MNKKFKHVRTFNISVFPFLRRSIVSFLFTELAWNPRSSKTSSQTTQSGSTQKKSAVLVFTIAEIENINENKCK